jgi:cell wall-associated NlpC family hydrolase
VSGRRLALAAAAEDFVGVPFRFRGRDPGSGLDCVGLVAAALSQLGAPVPELAPYSMRQRDFDAQLDVASLAGFTEVDSPLEPGDVLLLKPGPAQIHLAIVGRNAGLVHAHASLGRVVSTPLPCPTPIDRHWRLRED